MAKKVILSVIILLLVAILYYAVQPLFSKPREDLNDPKLNTAILQFIGDQMQARDFKLPSGLQNWKAEEVLITKLEDLPGPQGNQRASTTIKGSYLAAGEKNPERRTPFIAKHVKFRLGRKYPEGISVQYIRLGM